MANFEHNSEKFGYINLDDLEGVQKALGKLEFDPGTIDGLDGPNTQNALRKFQAHASIKVDGKAGPATRQALVDELAKLSQDTPATS